MRLIITIIVIIIAMVGCGPENIKTTQSISPESRIKKLLEVGEYQLAAEESLKLAQLYPNNALHYQQKATEIYIKSGDIYAAKVVLESIKAENTIDIFINHILTAQLALLDNNPTQALNSLNIIPPAEIPDDLLIDFYHLRIQAFNLRGNIIEVINNRLNMVDHLGDNDSALKQNNKQIWTALNELSLPLLKQYRLTGKPVLASWIELTIINKTMFFKPELLEQSVSMWTEQYPEHPANTIIAQEILIPIIRNDIRPTHIALCLPFSGYKWESQAIRDGFLVAWFASTGYKPRISIYDSDALNISNVYLNAIKNGADFVVGPLEKQAITKLLENVDLKVTTLALNQIDTPMKENIESPVAQLIQFGLSPEDEARQIAIRASAEGYKRALIITPNNDKGNRLFEAFSYQWNTTDGKIIEHIKYPKNAKEYKSPVQSLLNANTSDKRSIELRILLNRSSINNETRLRGDADMIFMAADPVSARRIVPEFRFYQIDIPIYSTSDIYTGISDPLLNKDMDGVIFTQIPWILDPERKESFLQQLINKNWIAEKSAYKRFYALGIDAYQLIPHLGRLVVQNSVNYPGETGELYLSEDGHIQRKLMWAKFSQGRAEILDHK